MAELGGSMTLLPFNKDGCNFRCPEWQVHHLHKILYYESLRIIKLRFESMQEPYLSFLF